VTAGTLGFLTFTQCGHRPDRYGEPSRFDTIPSQPSRQSKLEACRVVHAGDNTPPFRTTHRYALNLIARQIQKAPAQLPREENTAPHHVLGSTIEAFSLFTANLREIHVNTLAANEASDS
jgi:hypothetical protein